MIKKTTDPKIIAAAIREQLNKYPAHLAASLYIEGVAVAAEAVRRTPVDYGRLRATAYVAPPEMNGKMPTVEVGFGTDYAVYVHERTDIKHTSGEAKFLANALNKRANGMRERIAKRTKRAIESGQNPPPISSEFPFSPSNGQTDSVAKTREKRTAKRVRTRESKAAKRVRVAEKKKAVKLKKQLTRQNIKIRKLAKKYAKKGKK